MECIRCGKETNEINRNGLCLECAARWNPPENDGEELDLLYEMIFTIKDKGD